MRFTKLKVLGNDFMVVDSLVEVLARCPDRRVEVVFAPGPTSVVREGAC